MKWQVILINPNQDKYDRWLIQTDENKLYPIKVTPNKESRKEIARHIAKIANIPLDRVMFMGERRRRDKLIVFNYMVLYDELPPF